MALTIFDLEYNKLNELESAFWSKVEKTHNCWNWKAYKTPTGYGEIGKAGKIFIAHRVGYELTKGGIPDGLELDHLCRNPSCVNPEHLEPVTHRENIQRWRTATKTHCPRGHPLVDGNLVQRTNRSHRECQTCNRNRARLNRLHKRGIPRKGVIPL